MTIGGPLRPMLETVLEGRRSEAQVWDDGETFTEKARSSKKYNKEGEKGGEGELGRPKGCREKLVKTSLPADETTLSMRKR